MPLENRSGVCGHCAGPIYKYPNPDPDKPSLWAHRNTSDWINDPHEASPAPAAPTGASE